jgi:hypothetical protein
MQTGFRSSRSKGCAHSRFTLSGRHGQEDLRCSAPLSLGGGASPFCGSGEICGEGSASLEAGRLILW